MVHVNPRLILLLAILGAGFYAGGQIAGIAIENQLNKGIEETLVIPSDFATSDPEGYADWLTNEDPDDPPKYKSYYFWNLTNSEAFLAGADPIVEEIGPFVYQQFDRKLDVEFSGDTVGYRTYTYYVYIPEMSTQTASLTDYIVNVNPSYLGVRHQAGSEDALATSFVAPALGQLISLLQSDFVPQASVLGTSVAINTTVESLKGEFVDNVLVQSTPLVLETLQHDITENFEFAVNATTVAGAFAQQYSTLLGNPPYSGNATKLNLEWFNSLTFTSDLGSANSFGSVAEVVGADLGFSNDTIKKLIHDGPDGAPIPGWFGDLVSGTGVLAYLELYANATDPDNPFDLTTLSGMYAGASSTQLGAAATFLNSHIVDNETIANAFAASTGFTETTQSQASKLFFEQWANATSASVPEGLDINGDGTGGDGFELSLTVDSNITLPTAESLFNASNSISLTNDSLVWFAALTNTTLQGELALAFGLDPAQMGLILNWLVAMIDRDTGLSAFGTIVNFSPLGVTNLDDIAYLHWGSPVVTSGVSVFDLDPTVGGYVEFWAWASNIASDSTSFNLGNSTALLTGEYNLTDGESLGTFQFLGSQAVFEANATALGTLNALFGTNLDTAAVGLVLGYLDYMLNDIVLPSIDPDLNAPVDLAIKHWASPDVTGGATLLDLDPTLAAIIPGDPEFWAVTGTSLSFADATGLLTSNQGTRNITSILGLINFLAPASAIIGGDTLELFNLNSNYGVSLTTAEYTAVVSYIQSIKVTFIIEAELQPIVNNNGGLITSHTVEEWLWDVDDTLLSRINDFDPSVSPKGNLFANHTSPEDPRIAPPDIFNTGAEDIDLFMQYEQWNGMTEIEGVWNTTVLGNVPVVPNTKIPADLITGTDATQFAPGVTRSDTLVAFVTDLWRAVTLTYIEDTAQFDIELFRFVLSKQVLAKDPIFFQNIQGMANLTTVAGAPIYLSKPHFLDADESVYNLTQGLNADRTIHETVIDVEPRTGAVMNAQKRLQINLFVKNDTLFTSGVKPAFVPLAWVEEGGTITEDVANTFREAIEPVVSTQNLIGNVSFIAGLVLLISAAILAVVSRPKA